GGNNLIAGFQEFHHGIDGGKATCECQPITSIFYTGQSIFQCGPRWVGASGVFISFMSPRRVLGIGGSLVNWRHHGSIGLIGVLSSMDCLAIEPQVFFVHFIPIYLQMYRYLSE